MEAYVGKNLRVKTESGCFEGKMAAIDVENGKIVIETSANQQEIKFNDVCNLSLLEEEVLPAPLKESDMYMMLYEAFNVFGPFEDQFIYNISYTLKKFFKDISTADVKIVVGSDDVFGRIGLCFARLIWNRAAKTCVELRCDLNDIRTLRYKNAFENSGGYYNQHQDEKTFSMLLFAGNRNIKFDLEGCTSNQVLLLDIPQAVGLPNFIGLGLGFVPENFASCGKFYYLIDVGFGAVLARKYRLPLNFKNSLMKIEVKA